MQAPPNETVQLFFNGNAEKPNEPENIVYKNYIVKQNNNLLEEIKTVRKDLYDMEKKMEEVEDQHDTLESRFRSCKQYLKNFRFINASYQDMISETEKTMKLFKFRGLLLELRVLMVLFSLFLCLCSIFGFTTWYILVPLHIGYLYTSNEFVGHQITYMDKAKDIMIKFHKTKKEEIKKMSTTMDIISEFIDNGI